MVLYSPGRTSSYPTDPVDSGIRIHFLGGGDEVGNVGCVFEDSKGTKMLLDYGLAPIDTLDWGGLLLLDAFCANK